MDERPYIKVALPGGRPVLCKLTSGVADCLLQCENCKFLTQNSLKLSCGHYLCDECHENVRARYICQQDNRRTRKGEVIRTKKSLCSALERVELECPECGSSQNCINIVDHVRKEHPELFNEPPRGIFETLKIHEGLFFGSPLRSCKHCRQEFQATLETEEEHYVTCPRKPVFCPFKDLGCKFEAPRQEMESHVTEVSHSSFLVGAISDLQTENKELRKNFEEEKHAQAAMYQEKIIQLEEKMVQLQKEVSDECNHRMSLEEELVDLKREAKNSHEENKILAAEVTDLKKRLNLVEEAEDHRQEKEEAASKIISRAAAALKAASVGRAST